MRNKRGKKKMAPTSFVDLSKRIKKKQLSQFTQVKPIRKMTSKEMDSTAKFLKSFDERD